MKVLPAEAASNKALQEGGASAGRLTKPTRGAGS